MKRTYANCEQRVKFGAENEKVFIRDKMRYNVWCKIL